jgi:hypothetical protein
MNILKHMEAVFVATVVLAVSASYLVDTLPQARARQVVAACAAGPIPVVVVSAKRMSPQEKQQAQKSERASAANPASRI